MENPITDNNNVSDNDQIGCKKDIIAYRKKYYEENKDKYRKSEVCEICGTTYKLYNKSHHRSSKKHIYIEERTKNEKMKNELNNLKNDLYNTERVLNNLQNFKDALGGLMSYDTHIVNTTPK